MIRISFIKSYKEGDTVYKEFVVNGKTYVMGYQLVPVVPDDATTDTLTIGGQTKTIAELLTFVAANGDPLEGATVEWDETSLNI